MDPSRHRFLKIAGALGAGLTGMRRRGHVAGAARFAHGEGTWAGSGEIRFCCTSGAPNRAGQILRYLPCPHEGTKKERERRVTRELFIEPVHRSLIDMRDNLTVAPLGDFVVCEDGPDGNRLMVLARADDIRELTCNAGCASWLAGASSPRTAARSS